MYLIEHFSSNWVCRFLESFYYLKSDCLRHKQLPSFPVESDRQRGRMAVRLNSNQQAVEALYRINLEEP